MFTNSPGTSKLHLWTWARAYWNYQKVRAGSAEQIRKDSELARFADCPILIGLFFKLNPMEPLDCRGQLQICRQVLQALCLSNRKVKTFELLRGPSLEVLETADCKCVSSELSLKILRSISIRTLPFQAARFLKVGVDLFTWWLDLLLESSN